MLHIKDTGLIPEGMFTDLMPKNAPIGDYWNTHTEELRAVLDLAFLASARDPNNLPVFLTKITSPSALTRYWATQGILILGKQVKPTPNIHKLLTERLKDEHSNIRTAAAQALISTGEKELASKALLKELPSDKDPFAQLALLNASWSEKEKDKKKCKNHITSGAWYRCWLMQDGKQVKEDGKTKANHK